MPENSSVQFGSFIGYKQAIFNLTSDLNKLREHCVYLKLDKSVELIDEVLDKVANDSFDIAIVGEFKRGKSTLINSLLGKDVLPTDILPCSATLNRVTYSITPLVKIEYKDGHTEEIDINRLPDYVTKLTEESEKISETIREATVCYPINFCRNNVDIIDTPGLNDDQNMTDVTLSILPQVDAAILVIMAQSPFSDFERDFLENKLLVSDLGRVLFVVTGIDRCDEDEAERVLKLIEDRIQKYILKKAEKTLGADSEEFSVYKKKLGKPKVFGVSAKQALKAKVRGDHELLERSRFPEFEKELERFLTEDRGAVFLQIPVNRILRTTEDILKSIEIHEGALKMKKDDFHQKMQDATKELNQLKARKDSELAKIDQASLIAYKHTLPFIDNLWQDMKVAAGEVIENFELSVDDIDKGKLDNTQQRLMEAVTQELKAKGQLLAETIQQKIEKELNAESLRLMSFSEDVASVVENIHGMFFANTQQQKTTGEVVAAAAAVFTGFGGIWSGYRYAGAKGALVGAVGSFGTAFGGGLLIGALGIPLAWPAILALGVVSIFTGGWITKKVFGKSQLAEFRKNFTASIHQEIDNLKSKSMMEEKVRAQVNEGFSRLKEKVAREVDAVIDDTENTLRDLNSKIERDYALTDKEKETLNNIRQSVSAIVENASRLNAQLVSILDR